MMAECPMGHMENLSHDEVIQRLKDDDFDCRENGCHKSMSYNVDEVLWDKIINRRDIGSKIPRRFVD